MGTRVQVKKEKPDLNDQVKEVKSTHDADEANRLLALGWKLLHGGIGHVDNLGYNVKPMFILGRVK